MALTKEDYAIALIKNTLLIEIENLLNSLTRSKTVGGLNEYGSGFMEGLKKSVTCAQMCIEVAEKEKQLKKKDTDTVPIKAVK